MKHTEPATRSPSARRATADRCASGCATPATGVPADDRVRIFERFGRSRVRPATRASASGCRSSAAIAEAHGGTVARRDASRRSGAHVPTITLPGRRSAPHGPHPDRRGRGTHRRRSSPRACEPRVTTPPSSPTAHRASTTRSPASSTWWSSTSACPASTASRCSTGCASQGSRDAGHRAHGPRLRHRHGGGARGRRRRLHAQAVPLRRAAGPGAAAAAPGRRRPTCRPARTSLEPAASGWTCAPAGRRSTASEVDLSAREFTLAEIFLRNPGQVLSREQLLTTCGASTSTRAPTSSTCTSATCAGSSAPTRSATVRGMGYRFRRG